MQDSTPTDVLYPPLEPYASGLLDVGNGHQIYFEQCGLPTGLPVVFLHGGPGSACVAGHRRFFDPAVFRVILFDQRGCGRSTPLGELRHNTSDDLVADIEALRQHVGVAQWLVMGGSWGAGLGLAYAAAHAPACLGLLLRGVFLGRAADVDWFFNGVRQFLPDAWAQLDNSTHGRPNTAYALDQCEVLNQHEVLGGVIQADALRGLPPLPLGEGISPTQFVSPPAPGEPGATPVDVLTRLAAVLHSPQHSQALAAALAWEAWEQSVSTHRQVPARTQCADALEAQRLLAKYRLQNHYVSQGCFWGDTSLLQRTQSLGNLPVALVHGRQDWVCRPQAAWDVHASLPQSRLRWVDDGNHSPFTPDMAQALVEALAHFAGHGHFQGWGQSFHPQDQPKTAPASTSASAQASTPASTSASAPASALASLPTDQP